MKNRTVMNKSEEPILLRDERGFSLIETLVAVLILTVGFLGVGKMLQSSMLSDRYNAIQREAHRSATSKVEDIRSRANYAAYGAGTSGIEYMDLLGQWQTGPTWDTGMVRQWWVDGADATGSRLVTVVVTMGAKKSQDLDTTSWFTKRRYTARSYVK
jgi:prepilin-type N-terminal cleavage/methylation domain-containing protein